MDFLCLFISLSRNTNIIFFSSRLEHFYWAFYPFSIFFLTSSFLFHTVFFLSLSTTQPDGFILPNLALLSLSKILYWQSTLLFQSFCCPITSVFVSETAYLYEERSKQTYFAIILTFHSHHFLSFLSLRLSFLPFSYNLSTELFCYIF